MDRPNASNATVRRRMERQRRADTAPEIALRRALHRLGLRFRVNLAPVPGSRRRADVVFTRARVAVFVDGCFWHVCPEHATWPKANAEWWREKLEANVRRDRRTDAELERQGWLPLRVWEHENVLTAAERVAYHVRGP